MIGLRLRELLTSSSNLIDLQAGDFTVMAFTPRSADRDTATISETIEIEVKDAPYGQSTIRAIQQMITSARERAETGIGRRVFLEFSLGTAGDTYWRSEIVDGRVELPEGDYHYDIMSGYLAFTLLVTRLNYWESLSESGVSLQTSFGSVTNVTQTVYGHHSFSDVRPNLLRAISIDGDLPTPCRFQIYNNYSSGAAGDLYIGHMLENDSNTLEHVIEGESSTAYGTSADVSSAANSGGQYYNAAFTSGAELILWTAPVSQLMQSGMSGNEFNIMIRMPSGATQSDVLVRASLATDDGLAGLVERWSGRETLAPTSGGWLTLGRVQLPPRYLTGLALPAPLRLRLHFQRLSGGGYAVPIDYVMFMPTNGFRKYRRHSYGLEAGVTLHDRPNEGNTPLLYTEGWSEGKLDNFVAEGAPILLTPNQNNLLCFAFTNVDTVLRSLTVRAFYRIRRLTV